MTPEDNPFPDNSAEKEQLEAELARIEKAFPEKIVRATIAKALADEQALAEERLASVYTEYEALSKQGVPFRECVAKLDPQRIRMLEQHIEDLKVVRRHFKVIPWNLSLFAGDYARMKEVGFTQFVRLNLHRLYYVESAVKLDRILSRYAESHAEHRADLPHAGGASLQDQGREPVAG